jgi:hypothetical protein
MLVAGDGSLYGTVWAFAVPEPTSIIPLLVTLAVLVAGRRLPPFA